MDRPKGPWTRGDGGRHTTQPICMGPLAGHCELLLVSNHLSSFRCAFQRTDHEFVPTLRNQLVSWWALESFYTRVVPSIWFNRYAGNVRLFNGPASLFRPMLLESGGSLIYYAGFIGNTQTSSKSPWFFP